MTNKITSFDNPKVDCIVDIIKLYGERETFGGNCGVFALFMRDMSSKIASDKTYSFGVATYPVCEHIKIRTCHDFNSADLPAFHVVVQIDDYVYDGDGCLGTVEQAERYLSEFSHIEYDEGNPDIFWFSGDDPHIGELVRHSTSHTLSIDDYHRLYKERALRCTHFKN